jgi:thiol-disulfide isomerase/thioredoxin
MSKDDPSLSPATRRRGELPRRRLFALAVAALLVMAGACDRPSEAPPPAGPVQGPAAFVPAAPALRVGEKFPALVAEGWLNGDPPSPAAPGVRLLVVDVWAHWCPLCRQGAPELMGLHKKYAGRGVVFVSVTNMDRNSVARFVDEFALPWPNGYGATAETITALGAGSGMSMPGYGVAPTLYLVGPDGRVVWSDGQARYAHVESAKWRRDVELAIEAALAQDPAPAR